MTARAFKTCLLIASLTLFTCCSKDSLKSYAEINQLQQQLANHFQEERVKVRLEDSYRSEWLVVTFSNSPFHHRERAERMKRAQETALFVTQHYPRVKEMQKIQVAFFFKRTRFLIFDRVEPDTLDWFDFDTNGAPMPEFDPYQGRDDFRRANVRYSKERNQTEVDITRVQLAGDLNRGLTLVPHFTVPGNVLAENQPRRAPRSVGLELASYSPNKLFSSDTRLTISAEGKTIYNGTARLMSSTEHDGTWTEFLSQQISYEQFSHMATAGVVSIGLGSQRYQLTSYQLEGLRDMKKYAE